MKTVRFSIVVKTCGEPEVYLLLVDPAKDRTFQAAIKAKRVMTVFQDAVGTKTDRGEIGFQPGRGRQFVVFPKSLAAFADRTVVGIKYDLIGSQESPKSARVPASQRHKAKPKVEPSRPLQEDEPEPKKVVAFKADPSFDDCDDEGQIAKIKSQVREAMAVLEEGKPVAAFNLLKRIVG